MMPHPADKHSYWKSLINTSIFLVNKIQYYNKKDYLRIKVNHFVHHKKNIVKPDIEFYFFFLY